MERSQLNRVIYAALMAAVTCIATMVIRVPSVGAVGYVNIGDTAVLICAWLIGGVYGALAAGIGSALADLLAGYAYYVPGTFIIKFTMALVAYMIFKQLKEVTSDHMGVNRFIPYIVSGIPAEIIMIIGYFFYKALILGKGFAAAVPSVFSNLAQGITCLITALLLAVALEKVRLPERE